MLLLVALSVVAAWDINNPDAPIDDPDVEGANLGGGAGDDPMVVNDVDPSPSPQDIIAQGLPGDVAPSPTTPLNAPKVTSTEDTKSASDSQSVVAAVSGGAVLFVVAVVLVGLAIRRRVALKSPAHRATAATLSSMSLGSNRHAWSATT